MDNGNLGSEMMVLSQVQENLTNLSLRVSYLEEQVDRLEETTDKLLILLDKSGVLPND